MNPKDDPTAELYRILDRAGLDGGTLMNSKKAHSMIVNEIRTKLVMELRSYFTRYGIHQFNAGAKSVKGKKIEVSDEQSK